MDKLKYPAGETVWVGYYNGSQKLMYIVTSKPTRDWYYLYELVDGKFVKLDRGKDPSVMVGKNRVLDKIRK